LEREILEEMHERIVKTFLDTIVLAKLTERNSPMSGYDVVTFIHDKLRIRISSGTVYSLLYSMERNGLIKGRLSKRKRVYTLTNKGEKKIKAISEAKEKILGLMLNLLI
jgi:DNA-binding PadR family transcriptional regulator